MATFSVGAPSASARTSAAAADGASPTTDPRPCWASHAARTPAIVVDFPVPAAPTSTSSWRGEVTTWRTASACSADSGWPRPGRSARTVVAATAGSTDGPSRASAGVQEPLFGVQDLLGGVELGVAGTQP